MRFGIIADIQYGDCETRGSRFYRNSLPKLDTCINAFNKEKVQFTINLGDLVDRSPNDFEPVLTRLKKLDSKVYNTTGNHDYHDIKDNKKLYKKLGMPAEYYSFKKGNWRFIVLNTNEVSSYANVVGTFKEAELKEMQEKIKSEKRNNGAPWNGGISSKQMEWLKKQLEAAQKKNERVIIFAHHPVYPFNGLTALNDREILNTIAAFPCVKAFINGHHHPGDYGEYENIPCITTEGMIETESQNAYCIVDIFENEIAIKGFGRSKSYNLNY